MYSVLFIGKGTITTSLGTYLSRQAWRVDYHRRGMGEVTNIDTSNYDYVVCCTPDADIALHIWSDVLIAGMKCKKRKTVYIDLSTLTYEAIISIHQAFSQAKLTFIEAPFTGSKTGALSGQLVYFSFSDSVLPDADSFLQYTSRKIHGFKSPGAATRFKLFYNLWGLTALGLLGQMLPVLRSLSQPDLVIDILTSHPEFWMGPIAKDKLDQSLKREFKDVHCKLKYAKKDMRYAIDEFSACDLDLSRTLLLILTQKDSPSEDNLDFTSIGEFFK